MEPPKKKTKFDTEKQERPVVFPQIPEEILFSEILPSLSFKVLAKFKSVCKSWCNVISSDPHFSLLQSRRAASSAGASSLVYYCGRKGRPLVFLPTSGCPIGVPDPHLTFTPHTRAIAVRASTNGLLCVECQAAKGIKNHLYVCNPATKEGHVVADPTSSFIVGLAFDPLTAPDRYKLVCLYPRTTNFEYRTIFQVFSSKTGIWVGSTHVLKLHAYAWFNRKHVFVGGMLYWNGTRYLLCYDPEHDVQDIKQLPFESSSSLCYIEEKFTHDIGACDGRVTCTRFHNSGLEVWLLTTNGVKWEKYYQVSLERLGKKNLAVFGSCWQTMDLRSRKLKGEITSENQLVPLGFYGGDKLHLRRGKMGTRRRCRKVLCYDMVTEKIEELYDLGGFVEGYVFSYANSMVKLPKFSQVS